VNENVSPTPIDGSGVADSHIPALMSGSLLLKPNFEGGNPGLFLYVPLEDSAKIALQTRVYRANDIAGGIIIPAVKSDEVLHKTVHLLGIPAGPQSRVRLRIYDVSGAHSGNVRVITFAGAQRSDLIVALSAPGDFPAGSRPSVPAYAEIALPLPPATEHMMFVDIEPLGLEQRLWAFSTTTDDNSGNVVAVLPSR